jgi:hypothetical protein
VLVSLHLSIIEPGVGEPIRQRAFSLLDVMDEAFQVGTALTTDGYVSDSGKN